MVNLIPTLQKIAGSLPIELEWLDLLSQLEYVGARKILKAIPFENVSLSILQHVAEEASHAFLLKNVATRLGLPGRSWKDGKLSAVGWRYFRDLDASVSALGSHVMNRYPAVAWAIERRVMEVYPVYAEVTSHPEVKRVLSAILAQERRHGIEFEELVFDDETRKRIVAVEAPLWDRFSAELDTLVSSESSPARG